MIVVVHKGVVVLHRHVLDFAVLSELAQDVSLSGCPVQISDVDLCEGLWVRIAVVVLLVVSLSVGASAVSPPLVSLPRWASPLASLTRIPPRISFIPRLALVPLILISKALFIFWVSPWLFLSLSLVWSLIPSVLLRSRLLSRLLLGLVGLLRPIVVSVVHLLYKNGYWVKVL